MQLACGTMWLEETVQGCGVGRFFRIPTPAVLKNRLRLHQFWKTDSDSISFEKPTPTPSVLKNRLRLHQFWKTDSDSISFEKPTPTPSVLKNQLRLQQFWKTDSDSSSFKNRLPTPAFLKTRLQQFWKNDSDSRLRLQLKTCDSTDSDSNTLVRDSQSLLVVVAYSQSTKRG